MTTPQQSLAFLRQALAVSPDNVPLRRHLAQTLMSLGQFAEAEAEFRTALAAAPNDLHLKADLATVYFQQGKTSQSLVVIEDVLKHEHAPPAARVLYARLLLQAGDTPRAVAQYKLAIEQDPNVRDAELSERLGVGVEGPSDVFEGRQRAGWEPVPDEAPVDIERPKITFKDVGGMDAVKEEISLKIIYPLQHPELYKAYGRPIGGGILLYGPPGCGKTYLARATAGEIHASFLAVGIDDVLNMWIGNSERNLHGYFEQARANRPCVLFFDEVDALGGRRSDAHASGARHLVNQFLSEMDGIASDNEGVLILAATNAPWQVDAAFRRPGRFDRVLFVPPPDAAARAAILRIQLTGKPADRIDFDQLGKNTDGFSGADLKAIVDVAIEAKLRDAVRGGGIQPLTTRDLAAAAKQVKSSTREWFSTARNYALYSNEGGLYDDILKYVK